jgi:hypothetical protein
MNSMFRAATVFDQDLSGWTTNSVTVCTNIFDSAPAWQGANKPTMNNCTP